MPNLLLKSPRFFSQLDEDHFFFWLRDIAAVTAVEGASDGLKVKLKSSRISDASLRDLLAIHHRYGLDMRALRQFESERNSAWLRSPGSYWHKAVFG